jgi:hypothetical protein
VQVSIRPEVANTVMDNEPGVVASHLDRLPRRVSDASGRPGDIASRRPSRCARDLGA